MTILSDGTEVPDSTLVRWEQGLAGTGLIALSPEEVAQREAESRKLEQEQAATQHIRNRQNAYVTRIGTADDQLGMIWGALENLGSTAPEIAVIAAIKAEFPKP